MRTPWKTQHPNMPICALMPLLPIHLSQPSGLPVPFMKTMIDSVRTVDLPPRQADFALCSTWCITLQTVPPWRAFFPTVSFFEGLPRVIRRYLIEDCNFLDAVIGLPAKALYGTGIPTCILVLKNNAPTPMTSCLLIPVAEGNFEKVGKQNETVPSTLSGL